MEVEAWRRPTEEAQSELLPPGHRFGEDGLHHALASKVHLQARLVLVLGPLLRPGGRLGGTGQRRQEIHLYGRDGFRSRSGPAGKKRVSAESSSGNTQEPNPLGLQGG